MSRLWIAVAALAALWFYGAGCSERGIDATGDGGGSCAGLDEKSCPGAGCVADYCADCSCDNTEAYVGCRSPSAPHLSCPLHGCPACVNCGGLSEKDCLAAEQTLGCTAEYCPDCNGGQAFLECSGPGAGAGQCPAHSCPISGCRGNQDCSSFEVCVAPGASAGCGICMTGMDCSSDGDCSGGQICGTGDCICTPSGKACVPGCAQAGCPEGQMCGDSDHCVPVFCLKAGDCPDQFSCNEGVCIRKSCSLDSDCSGGFCVENSCYTSLGQCMPEPV